jgi:chromosome segregation ATPase
MDSLKMRQALGRPVGVAAEAVAEKIERLSGELAELQAELAAQKRDLAGEERNWRGQKAAVEQLRTEFIAAAERHDGIAEAIEREQVPEIKLFLLEDQERWRGERERLRGELFRNQNIETQIGNRVAAISVFIDQLESKSFFIGDDLDRLSVVAA